MRAFSISDIGILGLALTFSLCTTICELRATDRYFSDCDAVSANGQFRFTAKSPDNEKGARRPFQSNFKYKLVDLKSEKEVWVRKQERGEASPMQIFVGNGGWCVVHTGRDQLLCIDPDGQNKSLDILEDGFQKKEREEYVAFTTAGPMWSGGSLWYFSGSADQPVFVIRPWWGRRIVVDLSAASFIDASPRLERTLDDTQDALVIEALKPIQTLEPASLEKLPSFSYGRLRAAILVAGQTDLRSAVPVLRRLEASDYQGSSTFSSRPKGYGAYSTYTWRQLAQLSLRRLGEIPEALPCHEFRFGKEEISKIGRPSGRHTRVDELQAGISAGKVLELLGPPDFIRYGWSWDMDAESPFSLTIRFDDEAKVTELRRQRPPIWKSGLERDHELMR